MDTSVVLSLLACALVASTLTLSARVYLDGRAFLLDALPRNVTGTSPQALPPGVVGLVHPSMAHIPASIPAWAYDTLDFAQPERFRDPITNLTGPLLPPPPPHEVHSGWPTAKAQGFEDIYAVASFFYGLERPGFMAETGALDGLQFSTSWWFAYVLGWRVIHVEASPNNFRSLVGRGGKSWGGRPEALSFNAALCAPEVAGNAPLHYAEKESGTPYPTDGIWEFFTQDYKATWWPEALANASMVESFAVVHCSSLDRLLEPFEVPFLDLWVVDVEGGELSVLESHDFVALPVNVLCVEADDFNPAKNAAVHTLLMDKGFIFHGKFPWEGSPLNDWFVHSSFTPLKQPGYRAA